MPGTNKHDYSHKAPTPEQLEALKRWMLKACSENQDQKPVSGFHEVLAALPQGYASEGSEEHSGLIAWRLTEEHGPRYYDPPVVAAVVLITAFGGNVVFQRSSPKKHYATVTFPGVVGGDERHGSKHLAIDRLTMNAQPGEVVREDPKRYRNRSSEVLTLGRGSGVATRTWAIHMALHLYDIAAASVAPPTISRTEYELMLHLAFLLIDQWRKVVPRAGLAA